MVHSNCTVTRPGMEQGLGLGSMGSSILCRNVHNSPRLGQGPGPIVSYCACTVPCTSHGPGPVQCE